VVDASVTWNYTTWFNIAFLILAILFFWRLLKTGGLRCRKSNSDILVVQPAEN
jgi:hypothetical protein